MGRSGAGMLPGRDFRLAPTLDGRFWLAALGAGIVSLLAFGLVAAIIPNPVFGRTVPPDGAQVAIWLASAPLMGLLAATYLARPACVEVVHAAAADDGSGSAAATLGSMATFFAIGCPVCNKIVLLALGTSGAMNLFAPIQPLLGAASITLLAVTLAWRLRRRARGCAACTVRQA